MSAQTLHSKGWCIALVEREELGKLNQQSNNLNIFTDKMKTKTRLEQDTVTYVLIRCNSCANSFFWAACWTSNCWVDSTALGNSISSHCLTKTSNMSLSSWIDWLNFSIAFEQIEQMSKMFLSLSYLPLVVQSIRKDENQSDRRDLWIIDSHRNVRAVQLMFDKQSTKQTSKKR